MGKHDDKIAWLEDGVAFMRDLGGKLASGATKITEGGVDISKDLAKKFEAQCSNYVKLIEAWKRKND